MAKERGNESRDPLKPFGDIPTGEYGARVISAGSKKYGPHERIDLHIAVSGDAVIALGEKTEDGSGGRYGLLIHGGPLNAAGKLRPTYGCARLRDEDMRTLLDFVKKERAPGELLSVRVQELPL